INKGDIITLYTDGITEARNIEGDFYGDDRLINFYNKEDFDSLIELQCKLKDDVKYFVNEAPQADDMTILILEYRGDVVSTKQLEVTSKKENLEEVLEFSRQFVEENKISQIGVQLELIIDELYSNVNKYAYGGEVGLFFLRLSYNKTKHMLSMTFIDHGPEFNPLKTEAKIVEDENAKEGGLGILIVKNFADSITYNRIDNKNILLIKKLV
ncbi:MAG: ATP-binding protein, partial [Acholeplasmatales bacterium]|nr:ATP-binding protein [Acholeplasmatales bacterium]